MKLQKYTHARCVEIITEQCNFTKLAKVSISDRMLYNAIAPKTDKVYTGISRLEVMEAMGNFELHRIPYVTDDFDCDDYSICLAGILARYCVGIIHVEDYGVGPKHRSRYHALNVCIDPEGGAFMADAMVAKVFDPYEDYHIFFMYL